MIDFFLHLDTHLISLIAIYGVWIYSIVFVVIFCETGLVVTPFLPGDSLLFLLGALAAQGLIDIKIVLVSTFIAAFLGDTVNYHIGKILGTKVFISDTSRIFKKKYLTQTQKFYELHGNKAIIMARFIPIIRTFAPFVAGIGKMPYRNFMTYNLIGGAVWVALFAAAGYLFGNIPFIQKNLTLLVLGIIFLSLLPTGIEYIRSKISHHV